MNLRGHWHNAEPNVGWKLTFIRNEQTWLGTKPIWLFQLTETPLQWHTDDGLILEPCRKSPLYCLDKDGFPTDGGSVPWIVTFCIDALLSPAGFCLHNIGYQAGYEWAIDKDYSAYKIWLSRSEQDELLHWRCQTPPEMATSTKADFIWAGVRAGGWKPWNKYRKQDKQE